MTTRFEILQKCRELEEVDPMSLDGVVSFIGFRIQCCKEEALKKQQRMDNKNVVNLADYRTI